MPDYQYKGQSKERIYYKFKAKLIFNKSSSNLYGVDLRPRYYVLATNELIECLYWSNEPTSMDKGYFRDHDTSLYLRNIPENEMSDEDMEGKFSRVRNTPPYGYSNELEYVTYVKEMFHESKQLELETQFEQGRIEGLLVEVEGEDPYIPLTVEHYPENIATAFTDWLHNPKCTTRGLPSII